MATIISKIINSIIRSTSSSSQLLLASKMDDLSLELHLWMSSKRLSLNSSKTRLIWSGTTQQLQKVDIPLLSHGFPHFTFLSSVCDLGVTLDSSLTFSTHISNLTRSSYFPLRRRRAIRKFVSIPVFTSIVHTFVYSHIDYCDSLLIGLPNVRLSPIQNMCPMLPFNSLLVFPVSLASPLL